MKYVASCSCGKDSLFMILELIRREWPLDLVVYYKTGKDFKSIEDTWVRLKEILDANDIAHVELEIQQGFDYLFSEKPINTRGGQDKFGYSWCGGAARWATKLKTQAIAACYKERFGDEAIVEYIGIAADELQRVASMKRQKHTVKMYPLILWGYTENDCLVGCYKQGFEWLEGNVRPYQILDRVSCYCCANKNLAELRSIWKYLPEYWEELKNMQARTDRPLKKYGSVFELEKRFALEEGK